MAQWALIHHKRNSLLLLIGDCCSDRRQPELVQAAVGLKLVVKRALDLQGEEFLLLELKALPFQALNLASEVQDL